MYTAEKTFYYDKWGVANICKALCGVAAGTTRIAILNHFAKNDNVTGKFYFHFSREKKLSILISCSVVEPTHYHNNL